ncbi:uncharacterized protein K02A2.6-like [Ruditapes philippinarum]|uniref:uncharacterized protein K02A2.6-like n=1 Tax=Ruditapes philippinarum TaxID=129788 RepID=UPI00295B657A|nr:uncharacterized protein K02A2.6-like [Ruditapes philippinarum]
MPRSLRSEMLKMLHSSHLGAQKCLSRARSIMFWPGISNDIIEMVNQCQICLEYRSSQQKEPLISSEIPDYPFQIAGCDLFSDSSQEFKEFSKSWDFVHVKCSPYHNQTNGLAEAMVKVAKRILKKAKDDNSDPKIGFLEYRSTPLADIGNFSLAQLVQSRQLRSILPTVRENLIPRVPHPDVVKQKITESKVKSKHYYDKNAKPLSPLNVGDSARIQRLDKSWSPTVVIKFHSDRSYIVET